MSRRRVVGDESYCIVTKNIECNMYVGEGGLEVEHRGKGRVGPWKVDM